jgi:hypothetical protein
MDRQIKTFHDKDKLTEFMTTKPVEDLKEYYIQKRKKDSYKNDSARKKYFSGEKWRNT